MRRSNRPARNVSAPVALQISSAVLTPAQRRFNSLLRHISQARERLAAWHDNQPAYREAHVAVVLPLQKEVMAGQKRWVFALDALPDRGRWTNAERATVRDLILEAAGALLAAGGDDFAVKAVFDKYSDVDYDSEQRERVLALKDIAEAMTGLDLGDDEGIDSSEDLFARMQQGLRDREAFEEPDRGAEPTRRRQSGTQRRREAEAQQATQSVREIYRKLASALHPDRETDSTQRREKTALMQRVNQAYAGNDLLALLELQLQIEQIDASHIANAGADRLKQYNTVLAEQLEELKAEVARVEMEFCTEFGLRTGSRLDPRKLGELLEDGSRAFRAELEARQREMRMLDDVAMTKQWLKRQKQRIRDEGIGFWFERP
jgi:hypothetical protein